jgi:hypothetical protein
MLYYVHGHKHGEKLMNQEIQGIFKARDEAVRKQDTPLFLSTQLFEIAFGSSKSYLSINGMTTEVLNVHKESEDDLVVFAKETYTPQGKHPHSSFLIYFLTATRKGWKIYKIR